MYSRCSFAGEHGILRPPDAKYFSKARYLFSRVPSHPVLNLTGLNKLKFLNKIFFLKIIHASKGRTNEFYLKRDFEKFKGYIYSIPG